MSRHVRAEAVHLQERSPSMVGTLGEEKGEEEGMEEEEEMEMGM
jgi:hypothetical protein